MKNGMCTLYVWNTSKFGNCLHCTNTTSALTIVIESVGKILFWQKKNTNSYLKRHLAHTLKDLKKAKNEINKMYLLLMYQLFLILATVNINMSAKHVFNFMPKWEIILGQQSIE